MLTHPLDDAVDTLAGGEVDVDEDELAGVERPPADGDPVRAGGVGVEVHEIVAPALAFARARTLGRPGVGRPRVALADPFDAGSVVVAEEEGVEVDGRRGEEPVGVPVGVGERLEQPVGDERGVGSVVGRERVVEVVAARAGDVVEAVERGVADPAGVVAKPLGQPERLEHVEPLAVPGRLVVADDGEKGNSGVAQARECLDGADEVRQVGAAVVVEVAGVDNRRDALVDGVVHHALERRHEVAAALRRVVLPVAEVGVGGVEQASHAAWYRRRR
ncbi:MAG: hypothetical protein A07HB70_00055 [uncultured archaeon A07HB70]|nr:MAG: hypothetical protein A07HB70_00055 [uncultured archaeon A07HB70]